MYYTGIKGLEPFLFAGLLPSIEEFEGCHGTIRGESEFLKIAFGGSAP